MSAKLSHVRKAIYGVPWAITEHWLEAICEIYENHAEGKPVTFEKPKAAMGMEPGTEPSEPYQVVNGVAVLPLMGPIFPRANMMTELSGATSLQDWGAKFDQAMEDPNVMTLLMHVDSPGGSVVGLSEMAIHIFEARTTGDKMIASLIEGMGCSAAYMLASQAELCVCTEGSMVGSIGTLMKVTSMDRAEKNVGIDTTVLRSSELKAAGSGPLTPRQQDSLMKTLGAYFEQFKSAVHRGRPAIDMVTAATGEVWIGAEAERMGLVDDVTTLPKLLAFLAE